MKKFEYKHVNCTLPSGVDGMMKEVEKREILQGSGSLSDGFHETLGQQVAGKEFGQVDCSYYRFENFVKCF